MFTNKTADELSDEDEDSIRELDEAIIESNRHTILKICEPFLLDNDNLQNIKNLLLIQIKRGLCRRTHLKSEVKCYPTFVRKLPRGCENGNYLAMSVDSSICHVTLIQLHGDVEYRPIIKSYEITQNIKMGPGRDLFDFMAACLSNFIHKYELEKELLHLGLTFCFGIQQLGLSKGILVRWSKEFQCSAVIGRDVVALFRDAIDRRKDIKIGAIAILNDSTATLMSCAWRNKYAKIGVVVNEGTNACYLEKTKYVESIQTKVNSSPTIIINTEWAGFGETGTLDNIRTEFDKLVDEISINPGEQIFEKMISGLYLGEIIRNVIVKCMAMKVLFHGKPSGRITTQYALSTVQVMDILNAEYDEDYTLVQNNLKALTGVKPSEEDLKNIRYICQVIIYRSAYLLATGISCLIDRIGDAYTVVGIDSFIYRDYPNYQNILENKIKELTLPEHKFNVMLSIDGTGRGAALVAAVMASRKQKKPCLDA